MSDPMYTSKLESLEGRRFGRWFVVAYAGRSNRGDQRWRCRCDCGHERDVKRAAMLRGDSLSCGCLQVELARTKLQKRMTTHGATIGDRWTPTYKSWHRMRERCERKGHNRYARYGGRGISVCARWATFENFLADMGERPDGHSIDRIKTDGNYEPSNCRWATRKQQARNTTTNHQLRFQGKTMCVAEWGECLGIAPTTITHRLRRGWTTAKALTTSIIAQADAKGGEDV